MLSLSMVMAYGVLSMVSSPSMLTRKLYLELTLTMKVKQLVLVLKLRTTSHGKTSLKVRNSLPLVMRKRLHFLL